MRRLRVAVEAERRERERTQRYALMRRAAIVNADRARDRLREVIGLIELERRHADARFLEKTGAGILARIEADLARDRFVRASSRLVTLDSLTRCELLKLVPRALGRAAVHDIDDDNDTSDDETAQGSTAWAASVEADASAIG